MESLASSISQQLNYFGHAYLEHFQPEISTLQLANEFGQVLKLPGIPVVQQIVPKQRADASTNLYSGNYGLK